MKTNQEIQNQAVLGKLANWALALGLGAVSLLYAGCLASGSTGGAAVAMGCSQTDFYLSVKGGVVTPTNAGVNGTASFCYNTSGKIPVVTQPTPDNFCSNVSLNCVTGSDGNVTCDSPPTTAPTVPAGYVSCTYSPGQTTYCANTFAVDCYAAAPADPKESCKAVSITNSTFGWANEVTGSVAQVAAFANSSYVYYLKSGVADNSPCLVVGTPTAPSCSASGSTDLSNGTMGPTVSQFGVTFTCNMIDSVASKLPQTTVQDMIRSIYGFGAQVTQKNMTGRPGSGIKFASQVQLKEAPLAPHPGKLSKPAGNAAAAQ